MTDGTAFTLLPGHLGRNGLGEVWLHVRVSAALDGICATVPGAYFHVRDRRGARVQRPGSSFVATVAAFEALAETAPQVLVVRGGEAAAQVGRAFPDMPAGPDEGVAFELDAAQLGRDRWGLVQVAAEVRQAIDAVLAAVPEAHCQVLDGEGLPLRGGGTGRQVLGFGEALDGFEPQYLAFADRRAAAAFARRFPAMRRHELAGLERVWREATKP